MAILTASFRSALPVAFGKFLSTKGKNLTLLRT